MTADATFTDENEFHLFLQATAGLGPEEDLTEATQWSENVRSDRSLHRSVSERIVSPSTDTPTTIRALQSLATLPHATHEYGEQRTSQRYQYDSVLPPDLPSPGIWFDTYEQAESEVNPFDEEPPDYASSQAQAQAAQIAEAVRRAQELQRRWQQSR
jgi:hypothetical protein